MPGGGDGRTAIQYNWNDKAPGWRQVEWLRNRLLGYKMDACLLALVIVDNSPWDYADDESRLVEV